MSVPHLSPRWRQNRRLLVLLAASLLLHGLVLEAVERLARRTRAPRAGAGLAVRLVPGAPAPAAATAPVSATAATSPSALVPAAPAPSAGQLTQALARAAPRPDSPPRQPRVATAPAPPAPADSAPPPAAAVPPGVLAGALGLPVAPEQPAEPSIEREPPAGFGQVLPPAASVDYSATYQASAQARPVPAGGTRLQWERGDGNYSASLASDAPGTEAIRSAGQLGDEGIVPLEGPDGLQFDRSHGGVVRLLDGRVVPLRGATQDRVSVLIFLSAIAAAHPGRLANGVTLYVAGPVGPAPVTFVAVGEEEVDTPAGRLATVHLTQEAPAGSAYLELWLAPSRHWLPVMMRTTAPDGSSVTQRARRIEMAR